MLWLKTSSWHYVLNEYYGICNTYIFWNTRKEQFVSIMWALSGVHSKQERETWVYLLEIKKIGKNKIIHKHRRPRREAEHHWCFWSSWGASGAQTELLALRFQWKSWNFIKNQHFQNTKFHQFVRILGSLSGLHSKGERWKRYFFTYNLKISKKQNN